MSSVSASASPCVSFAPLPSIEPRVRNSTRPLGIAARGAILRQRRQYQDNLSYYDYSTNVPVYEEPRTASEVTVGDKPNTQSREGKEDSGGAEDPLVALGKMLNVATKVIWRRISQPRLKAGNTDNVDSDQAPSRPAGLKKSFSWRGRQRTISAIGPASSDMSLGHDDEESDSEPEVDGQWRRRKDEDPMTKTIMESSDDEHGIEQFVLAYDTVLGDEEDLELARVHDEIRTTVEVHVTRSAGGGTGEE
ncbi:hypothetical protein DFH11DRAFT_1579235 [Phellopilus nigrolimitatus]|nr:hypothetical protein DFH11DRAFT_1579235 [Phellopilus nigrolimitatus]